MFLLLMIKNFKKNLQLIKILGIFQKKIFHIFIYLLEIAKSLNFFLDDNQILKEYSKFDTIPVQEILERELKGFQRQPGNIWITSKK